jgi:hypothetical protein
MTDVQTSLASNLFEENVKPTDGNSPNNSVAYADPSKFLHKSQIAP